MRKYRPGKQPQRLDLRASFARGRERALRSADRVFRERQLLLRTDGRVYYVFLTPRLQQFVAAGLACLALVALFMGGRLLYQSSLVHRGEAQIAELQAENVEMASALANAAAVREAEESVAASVRRLVEHLAKDLEHMSTELERAGIDVSDILPRQTAASVLASVRPAARQTHDEYARDLKRLESTVSALTEFRAAFLTIPLARPVDDGRLTSGFGLRKHPVTGRRSMHRGVDISSVRRTPIYGPAPGIVTFVGTKGSFGKFIEIDHGRGFKTRYGHVHKILVRRGQRIGYRHRVALVGSTGRSTGPHLHYEIIFRGRHLDPEAVFEAGRNLVRK